MNENRPELVTLALEHVNKLLNAPVPPEIPEELAGNELLLGIHGYLSRLRLTLKQFASGEFTEAIKDRGVVAGSLKALQANLRHMLWQVRQVEEGDFSQRVQFLGEFSDRFNGMVKELHTVHSAMKKKEEELTELSEQLKEEVDERNKAFNALRQREAEFRYLAEHDPLTNTLNRRSFFQLAEVELKRCRLNGKPCGLALLDLDFFKTFNDTYGHIEGDKALRHVADVGKSGLRHKDIMARIGGEEFVFLFPEADLQQTKIVAERIRAAIAENPVILESGEPIQITASIGVIAVPPQTGIKDNMLASQAIRAADHGLYTSKKYGRNLVTPVDFAGFMSLFPEAAPEGRGDTTRHGA